MWRVLLIINIVNLKHFYQFIPAGTVSGHKKLDFYRNN